MDFLHTRFLPMLLGWSVAWGVAAIIGLWVTHTRDEKNRFWPGFWFLTGLWVAVNIAIGIFSLVAPPADVEEFRRLLLINAGLDVGYLAVAAGLALVKKPLLRGFALAITVQSLFLLLLDLAWWRVLA